MQTGLDFVLVNKMPVGPILKGKVGGFGHNESWNYNFGTRVGFGVYVDHDAWNLDFDWMWINATNSRKFNASSGSSTLPTMLADNGNGTSPYSTYATSGASWGCVFNVLDATLGKPYHISRKLIFNPHFGLRFAWIDQELGVNYGGTVPGTQIKHKMENDFWGVGARMGVNTDWILGYGFKFFSNISSSVLAGWFDNSQKYGTPNSTTVKISNNPQVVVPNLDLALGVDWGIYIDTCGSNCSYYLDFRAGYEFQIWWDQWNTRNFVTGVSDGNFNNVPGYGNLSLNGFTFKIQLDM
jgi:hypothetical protein